MNAKDYPFLFVFPWSETTFQVMVDNVGRTECNREQLRQIIEAWVKKHLKLPGDETSTAQKREFNIGEGFMP